MFSHSFEEGGLDFRRSTIDLICEEDMGEYWTFSFRESSLLLIVYLSTDEVHREKVGGERYPLEIKLQYISQSLHRESLPESWDSLEQHMTAREEDYEYATDEYILSDDSLMDSRLEREYCFADVSESRVQNNYKL
jgi:hypothetical protein